MKKWGCLWGDRILHMAACQIEGNPFSICSLLCRSTYQVYLLLAATGQIVLFLFIMLSLFCWVCIYFFAFILPCSVNFPNSDASCMSALYVHYYTVLLCSKNNEMVCHMTDCTWTVWDISTRWHRNTQSNDERTFPVVWLFTMWCVLPLFRVRHIWNIYTGILYLRNTKITRLVEQNHIL